MACDLSEVVEILEFANKIVGSTEKITIDSGIYEHDDNNGDESHKPKNSKRDIFVIDGTTKPIELVDVVKVFQEMQKQFDNTYDGCSYVFEGLSYNKNKDCYELLWGS
ncbi:putative orfan [Tupanvirus soda lake]|uniref:Orfan n=1 Tax=Tupanvirus deep ocean TaxID=2126984 RepID=A0AC59HC88_9VIRU|nr:putative orfan [Tupanvirus soda lake]AUL78566.2 putative orfan [Tupanvirus soda lake]